MSPGTLRIPANNLSLSKRFPSLWDALEMFDKTNRKEGALDAKTGHLIQLVASATIRSEGSVHNHTRRAVEAGATPEEIRCAVILLTATIGYSTAAAALSWVDEVLNRAGV